jgi:hypothetical protein
MILIYMNTGEWGGVDIFVARFACYLRDAGRDFVIVDHAGSRLWRDLDWARFVTLDELQASNARVDCVFLPSIAKIVDLDRLPARLRSARVFTWVVQHHDALYHFFPLSQAIVPRFGFRAVLAILRAMPRYRRRIASMFDLMIQKAALAVMDGSTIRSLRCFYPSVTPPPILVPLPVPLGTGEHHAPPVKDGLSIGYLGRMDRFKFSALGAVIASELAALAKTQPVTLVAITVGSHVEQLRRLCAERGITLGLHGFMPNDQARALLASETDLALAMGTAALDIAASGHPCLYIDPAEQEGVPPQPLFRFVHETQDYMVGEFRDFPGYVGGLRSLAESVRMVHDDPSLGQRGREYVRDRHDPDRINTTILHHLDTSRLTIAELLPHVTGIKRVNARDLATARKLRRMKDALTR